jgi:hypothetical protein
MSNFYEYIQRLFEEISMLAPFTSHHAVSVDDISDGRVGRCSMTFQESFEKDSIDTWLKVF